MKPASRLPLPLIVRPAEFVAKVYDLLWTVTVLILSQSLPGVESRPEACTLLTTNSTREPLGMRTWPFEVTALATDPSTGCPSLASFELTV